MHQFWLWKNPFQSISFLMQFQNFTLKKEAGLSTRENVPFQRELTLPKLEVFSNESQAWAQKLASLKWSRPPPDTVSLSWNSSVSLECLTGYIPLPFLLSIHLGNILSLRSKCFLKVSVSKEVQGILERPYSSSAMKGSWNSKQISYWPEVTAFS